MKKFRIFLDFWIVWAFFFWGGKLYWAFCVQWEQDKSCGDMFCAVSPLPCRLFAHKLAHRGSAPDSTCHWGDPPPLRWYVSTCPGSKLDQWYTLLPKLYF